MTTKPTLQSFSGTAAEWNATMRDRPTPPTESYTLWSGRAVVFTYPDMWELSTGQISIPNVAKQAIWKLLLRGGDDDPQQQLLADERYVQSLYYAAQLITTPRLKLDDDDPEGVIDRKEWTLPDLLAAWRFLRFGPARRAGGAQPGAPEDAALPGGGLSPGTA